MRSGLFLTILSVFKSRLVGRSIVHADRPFTRVDSMPHHRVVSIRISVIGMKGAVLCQSLRGYPCLTILTAPPPDSTHCKTFIQQATPLGFMNLMTVHCSKTLWYHPC